MKLRLAIWAAAGAAALLLATTVMVDRIAGENAESQRAEREASVRAWLDDRLTWQLDDVRARVADGRPTDYVECLDAQGLVVRAHPWRERVGLPGALDPVDPEPRARMLELAEGAAPFVAVERQEGTSRCTYAQRFELPDGGPWSRLEASIDAGEVDYTIAFDAMPGAIDPWPIAGLIALVALPLAAALGWSLGSRSERPTLALAEAIDAVARGEADYTFDGADREALGGLAALFSRWNRAIERQRARARQAERVAAWREVAQSVAHEVKNPLVPIRLTMENLKRAREREAPLFDELFESGTQTVLEEVDRLDRLVQSFSRFARLPEPRLESFDPAVRVRETAALFPSMRVELDLDGAPPVLRADRDQFAQVLHNLLGNAADVAEAVHVRLEPVGDELLLSVEDDGPGVAEERREAIFEPYVTDKAQGSGLGLAITRRILDAHGGTIELIPSALGGAGFLARWPVER